MIYNIEYSSDRMFTEILRGHELLAPHVYEVLTHLRAVRVNSIHTETSSLNDASNQTDNRQMRSSLVNFSGSQY